MNWDTFLTLWGTQGIGTKYTHSAFLKVLRLVGWVVVVQISLTYSLLDLSLGDLWLELVNGGLDLGLSISGDIAHQQRISVEGFHINGSNCLFGGK